MSRVNVIPKDEKIDLTLRTIKREKNLNILNFLKNIYGSTSELKNEYKNIKTELLSFNLISEVGHGVFRLTLLGKIMLNKGSYKDFLNRRFRQNQFNRNYSSSGGFSVNKLQANVQWIIIWLISIGLGILVYLALSA